ncbi:MAG: hypothetical protein Q7S83_02230 [bacterium]|nr:hypothetical protein [bacterium]
MQRPSEPFTFWQKISKISPLSWRGKAMHAETSTLKGSVILMDVENLTIQARHDDGCSLTDVKVLNLAIDQADRIAGQFGPLIRADAALSAPKSVVHGESADIRKKPVAMRKDNSRMMQCLIDRDFTSVILVPQGKDSADLALCEIGLLMANDARVQGVVLCTGDGGEPFFKLVQALIVAGKLVHVISYDHIPQSLKNLNLPCSLLVSDVRLASAEPEEKEIDSEAILLLPSCEVLEADPPPPERADGGGIGGVLACRAASVKRPPSFRSVLRAVKECNADTSSETYAKLRDALWFLAKELPRRMLEERAKRVPGRDPELLSPKYTIEVLEKGMKESLTSEEAKEIVFALEQCSDFFEPVKKFRFNPASDLLKQIKPF